MSTDEIERLIAGYEEQLYQAIKAAFDQTRQEIDIDQLAEAIASQDGEAIAAALDIAANTFDQQADSNLPDLIVGAFETLAIVAATVLGHTRYTLPNTARQLRDNFTYRLRQELTAENFRASLQSIKTMHQSGEPPRVVASYLVSNLGLTAAQQGNLDRFRALLVRGQRRGLDHYTPGQLRRFNASQRSILRSLSPAHLEAEGIDRLTNRQRKAMLDRRLSAIAQTKASELHNEAKQATWEHLASQGHLNGYRRFWVHAGDERVRHSHRAVSRINTGGVGLQQTFLTPLGRVHAPPLEVNCRCRVELRKPQEVQQ